MDTTSSAPIFSQNAHMGYFRFTDAEKILRMIEHLVKSKRDDG